MRTFSSSMATCQAWVSAPKTGSLFVMWSQTGLEDIFFLGASRKVHSKSVCPGFARDALLFVPVSIPHQEL